MNIARRVNGSHCKRITGRTRSDSASEEPFRGAGPVRAVRPEAADRKEKGSARTEFEERDAKGSAPRPRVDLDFQGVSTPMTEHRVKSGDQEQSPEVESPTGIMPLGERVEHAARYYEKSEKSEDGLGHDGGPDHDQPNRDDVDGSPEVIVVEEEEETDTAKPKVVRVPRIPTQRQREEHEATHLPHAEWCDICIKGRSPKKGSGARGGEIREPGR